MGSSSYESIRISAAWQVGDAAICHTTLDTCYCHYYDHVACGQQCKTDTEVHGFQADVSASRSEATSISDDHWAHDHHERTAAVSWSRDGWTVPSVNISFVAVAITPTRINVKISYVTKLINSSSQCLTFFSGCADVKTEKWTSWQCHTGTNRNGIEWVSRFLTAPSAQSRLKLRNPKNSLSGMVVVVRRLQLLLSTARWRHRRVTYLIPRIFRFSAHNLLCYFWTTCRLCSGCKH